MFDFGGVGDDQLVDAVRDTEHTVRAGHAAQIAAIAELRTRAGAWIRPGGEPFLTARDLAAAEIGPVLRLSRNAAVDRVELADTLVSRLPAVLAALGAGELDLMRVRLIAAATDVLSAQDAAAVAARVLPRAGRQTVPALRESVARAVIAADPEAAQRRHEQAVADRAARLFPSEDGMAVLWARLAAADAARAYAALTRAADTAKTPDDDRTAAARRADTLHDLLLAADTDLDPGCLPDPGCCIGADTTPGCEHLHSTDTDDADPGCDPDPGRGHLHSTDTHSEIDLGPDTDPAPDRADRADDADDAERTTDSATCTLDAAGRHRPSRPASAAEADRRPPPVPAAPTTLAAPGVPSTLAAPGVPSTLAAPGVPSALRYCQHCHSPRRDKPARSTSGRAASARAAVHVTAAWTTLAGLDDQPAHLRGHGPITAHAARIIAGDATWQRILTDPHSGTVLDVGTTTYTPPAALAAHVRTRDGHCRWPGCRLPAERCDLDHTDPYPHGPTADYNFAAACRHHHLIKTHTRWRVQQRFEGTLIWTSPTGQRHVTEPRAPDPPEHRYDDPPPPQGEPPEPEDWQEYRR